uniref:Rhodanese domain-containing protein n=1 Tax=Odontella aurita TaxID=265563 RepID=A0A7S4ILB6_9STRA|mmetsp:Transcript_26823/g.79264  ORF Transcript_26823/g.79264 Transcript_26823/m.79264 type:complete len:251 (+) Transcript_26823:118-870(+)
MSTSSLSTLSKRPRAEGTALDAMAEACGPRDCLYRWCADRSMYITQDELLAARAARPEAVVVVDCRDEDGAGGRIRGAVRLPDSAFASDFESRLLPALVALPRDCGDDDSPMVVFHCMESVRRGPRCAKRLDAYISNLRSDDDDPECAQQPPRSLSIRVLEGGADHWIRRFYSDAEQVEDFDDDYWGFLDGGGAATGFDERVDIVGSSDDRGPPRHRSYVRPSDQPATSWSDAGNSSGVSARSQQKDRID